LIKFGAGSGGVGDVLKEEMERFGESEEFLLSEGFESI